MRTTHAEPKTPTAVTPLYLPPCPPPPPQPAPTALLPTPSPSPASAAAVLRRPVPATAAHLTKAVLAPSSCPTPVLVLPPSSAASSSASPSSCKHEESQTISSSKSLLAIFVLLFMHSVFRHKNSSPFRLFDTHLGAFRSLHDSLARLCPFYLLHGVYGVFVMVTRITSPKGKSSIT